MPFEVPEAVAPSILNLQAQFYLRGQSAELRVSPSAPVLVVLGSPADMVSCSLTSSLWHILSQQHGGYAVRASFHIL